MKFIVKNTKFNQLLLSTCRLIAYFFLFCSISLTFLTAQKVSVHGSFGAMTEFYQFNSNDSTLRPRRPDFNYRIFFSPVIHIGKRFELPFNFELNKRLTGSFIPLPSNENFVRSFLNPNNAIGIHPTFGWASFHLGSHTAQFSELSTGNLPIFGAGFDLKPGRFRVAFSYGVSQWAIQADTTLKLDGSYERHFHAAKIGYGKKDASGVYLNFAKLRDFTNSIEGAQIKTQAQEGILSTIDFRIKLSPNLSFNGEIGGSAFTKNILSEEINTGALSSIPGFLLKPTITTRSDIAGKAGVELNYQNWGFALQTKYLGAGFESLGFGYVETDILDFTIAPRLQFFKNRLMLNGSIGQRQDNLAKTKFTTTRKLISSGNFTAMLTNKLTLSANYSNYGTRNSLDNDTLRLEFVAQNYSISPSYRFKMKQTTNTFSITYAKSVFDDKNLFSGERNSNNMSSISVNWTVIYKKMTLTILSAISKNKRSTDQINIQTWSMQPGIALLKRKINASCSFVYGIIGQTTSTDDSRVMLRPQIRWQANRRLQLRIEASHQIYQYGSIRHDARYDESFLKTGIIHSF